MVKAAQQKIMELRQVTNEYVDDAMRRTEEAIQKALADQESYEAQKQAEYARAALEKATLEADIIVKTEIEKQRLVLAAEAEAEQIRRKA